jgi:hypothetical protein
MAAVVAIREGLAVKATGCVDRSRAEPPVGIDWQPSAKATKDKGRYSLIFMGLIRDAV